MNPADILDFWFKEIDSSLRFKKDKNFDQTISRRFSSVLNHACRGELSPWRSSPEGYLAETTVLDHFGRYPHRKQVLGRASTPEEIKFFKQPNSGF